MKLECIGNWRTLALAAALAANAPALAEAPKDRPFSMRGIELGITIDEFRQAAIPNDEPGRFRDLQAWCSSDDLPKPVSVDIDPRDRADGLVNCKWFSADGFLKTSVLWPHWVKIGEGGGWPVFHFMKQDGVFRLFRISFYANNEYYGAILDALSRGYGEPELTIEPFKTMAGGDFTSATTVWDNGLSSITLVERCGKLDWYCLTYDHSEFVKSYRELQEQRAAAAANNI